MRESEYWKGMFWQEGHEGNIYLPYGMFVKWDVVTQSPQQFT